jgi:hypothetical protein
MLDDIDLGNHRVCLNMPSWRAASHWAEHVPFAMWLTSVMRPKLFVEIGTFGGTSYCGFCEAIQMLGLPTRAFSVDTWEGDPHNGVNGPEILINLRLHHDPRYGEFSTLLPMTFDQAVEKFSDGEIDLLHIDGYHTYEAVRHDYETWRGKLSDRGVILFHDVAERMRDFGVWRLWEELTAQYPSFTFLHEHGLGVLAVGSDLPDEVRRLVSLQGSQTEEVRLFFESRGKLVRSQMNLDAEIAAREEVARQLQSETSLRIDQENLIQKLREIVDQHRESIIEFNQLRHDHAMAMQDNAVKLHRAEAALRYYEVRCEDLGKTVQELQTQLQTQGTRLHQIHGSRSWRLASHFARFADTLAPRGSARRDFLREGKALLTSKRGG